MKLNILAIPVVAATILVAACATDGTGTTNSSSTSSSPSEADVVVSAVKSQQSDFRAFCMTGADNVRKVVTNTVVQMVASGEIKGDPKSVGSEAGSKIGSACRGG